MNDTSRYEIINDSSVGIILKHKGGDVFISFDECAANYANENSLETSKCVAVRDVTTLTFIFYTNPKVEVIFKKNLWKDMFFTKSAIRRFLDLEKVIVRLGFSSYDLS